MFLIGCGGRIRTSDLQLMRLAGTARLPYSAILGWASHPNDSKRVVDRYLSCYPCYTLHILLYAVCHGEFLGLQCGIRTHIIPRPKRGAITRLGEPEIKLSNILFHYRKNFCFIFAMHIRMMCWT